MKALVKRHAKSGLWLEDVPEPEAGALARSTDDDRRRAARRGRVGYEQETGPCLRFHESARWTRPSGL